MVADAEKAIGDYRKGQSEAMLGPSPETQQMQQQMIMSALMNYGLPFLLLALIGLLWAIFYYPAACLVAGYTRSFTAVINPLVGLDTIKRLGFSYVKILGMEILLSIILAVIIGVVALVLSPFDLPRIGNIPATLVTSFIYFYYYVAFAAILGYAVYKCKNLLSH
jgi:flagellar biosynthesis protein FlhB